MVAVATRAEALTALTTRRFRRILAETADAPTTTAAWTSLARLRQAAGATPVVITARDPALFADYAARGFAGLLAPPFDRDELLTQVQVLLQLA